MGDERGQRLPAGLGLYGLEPLALEHLASEPAHRGLIIHDEDDP
jgi:hypothetical protein